jgi:hypothetical protein
MPLSVTAGDVGCVGPASENGEVAAVPPQADDTSAVTRAKRIFSCYRGAWIPSTRIAMSAVFSVYAAGALRFTLPHGRATVFGMSAISSSSAQT